MDSVRVAYFSSQLNLGVRSQTEMHRDPLIFPSDENGDILWAMRMGGDDLTVSRDVNFLVLFDAEGNADSCAAEMQEAAFEVQVEECPEDAYDIPAWEVVITTHVVPSYERITALSDLIASMAASHGGVPDGWAAELSPSNSVGSFPSTRGA